jgi:hypothetical protein
MRGHLQHVRLCVYQPRDDRSGGRGTSHGISDRHRYDCSAEQTWRTPTPTTEMKPGIGPRAFGRETESVIRQLQAGETVAVEMTVRTGDRSKRAVSVKVLGRLVELIEGVGEVQAFDIRERVRPKVVLVPIPPPPTAAESTMSAFPRTRR